MEQKTIQIALDSCVVIELIEKQGFAYKLKNSLRGKPVRLVVCDVVLNEVQRVRGFAASEVISKISGLVGKKVETLSINGEQKTFADSITAQYQFCHRGDNLILALCWAKDFVLLTFDRLLLKACEFVGVRAFHPKWQEVSSIV
ncbi:MAG: type II toxin-antitoxin system VapC family toxin [Candidatus Nitrosotenuis sp.]|nr:type II toxin-antitoxin system VapC family toxin [Candidatus Nitrosotenuis sp.]